MTGITYPNSSTNSFSYNGMDTRVGKTDSTGTATYKRDGASVVAAVLSDGSATYTPGISERRSSTTTYLHSGMKNADSQSGTGQTLGASRQYDAFGNLTASYGTWKGPFGYAGAFGYQEDPDSTLKLLGHRYYDSSIGRFLTRDPAKDGRNWYAYCANGPVGLIDPVGYGAIAIGVEGEAVLSIPFIKPIEISFRYGVGVIYDSEKGWGGYTDGGIGIGFGESVHLLVAMEGLADAESGNQIQWNFGGGSGGYGQVSVVTPVANGKIAGIDGGGFGFGVGEGLSLSIAAVHRSILWIDDISGEGGGGSPPNIYDIWPTQQDWISYLQ